MALARVSVALSLLLVLTAVGLHATHVVEVPFTECEGALMPTSVRVDCEHLIRGTCVMAKGATYNVTADFTPGRDVQEVESYAAWNTWVEMPLYGHDRSVCDEQRLTCPLLQESPATLTYPLHIHPFVIRRRYPLIWRLKDVASDETVLCFVVKVQVVDPAEL